MIHSNDKTRTEVKPASENTDILKQPMDGIELSVDGFHLAFHGTHIAADGVDTRLQALDCLNEAIEPISNSPINAAHHQCSQFGLLFDVLFHLGVGLALVLQTVSRFVLASSPRKQRTA